MGPGPIAAQRTSRAPGAGRPGARPGSGPGYKGRLPRTGNLKMGRRRRPPGQVTVHMCQWPGQAAIARQRSRLRLAPRVTRYHLVTAVPVVAPRRPGAGPGTSGSSPRTQRPPSPRESSLAAGSRSLHGGTASANGPRVLPICQCKSSAGTTATQPELLPTARAKLHIPVPHASASDLEDVVTD